MSTAKKSFISYLINYYDSILREVISKKYPLTPKLISENFSKINYNFLSQNENIIWDINMQRFYAKFFSINDLSDDNHQLRFSMEIIDDYKEDINWKYFSIYHNLPWSMEFIEKYKHNIDWKSISRNTSVNWTKSLVLHFHEFIWFPNLNELDITWLEELMKEQLSTIFDYPLNMQSIPENYRVAEWLWLYGDEIKNPHSQTIQNKWEIESVYKKNKWDLNLILEHKSKVNWTIMSEYVNINALYFDKYIDYWDWNVIIRKNETFIWEFNHIQKYSEHFSKENWSALSASKTVKWNNELIENFQDCWSWYYLSQNLSLPLDELMIFKFENHWHWENLSYNYKVPLSLELCQKYEDKWYWLYGISACDYIFFDVNILYKYEKLINWGMPERSFSIIWDKKLLRDFKDKINWDIISENENVKWDWRLISEFDDYWNWDNLSRNESIPWNSNLVGKFINKWNWKSLSRNSKFYSYENIMSDVGNIIWNKDDFLDEEITDAIYPTIKELSNLEIDLILKKCQNNIYNIYQDFYLREIMIFIQNCNRDADEITHIVSSVNKCLRYEIIITEVNITKNAYNHHEVYRANYNLQKKSLTYF